MTVRHIRADGSVGIPRNIAKAIGLNRGDAVTLEVADNGVNIKHLREICPLCKKEKRLTVELGGVKICKSCSELLAKRIRNGLSITKAWNTGITKSPVTAKCGGGR